MATSVYEVENLALPDGTDVEMRPLKIVRLRKFMKLWTSLPETNDDDEGFDVLTNLVVLAMEQYHPEAANKDFIEENLDMDDYRRIIKAASGIELNDNQGNV